MEIYDYDNGRTYVFDYKGSELFYFDVYEDEKCVEHGHAFTLREVRRMDGGEAFLHEFWQQEEEEE